MASTILVIDSEKGLRELIKENLLSEGFEVLVAASGEEGISKLDNSVDLILLDYNFNQINGLSLSKKIRDLDYIDNKPVILLIIREEKLEEIINSKNKLKINNYIIKPFSFKRLLAKINSCLNNNKDIVKLKNDTEKVIKKGPITVNMKTYEVKINNRIINLTPKEFSLLKYLLINENNILSRDKLLKKIWGYQYSGDSRTVDVHIRRLREKIGEDYIKTVRGIGYKFVVHG